MKMRTIGLILFARLACGQDAASVPTFKATTKLVSVSVIAHDKQGKPVRDLRREDFQVFDNGSPKELQLFVAETEPSATGSPESIAPTQSPGTFSNQIASAKASPTAYSVILIDNLFTPFGDPFKEPGSSTARAEALKMLQSIPDGEHIAIYAVAHKMRVICEFTTDRDLLVRQLQLWKPDVGGETADGIIPTGASMYHDDEVTAASPEPDLTAAARVDDTRTEGLRRGAASSALMDLVADHLAGIPGRKNLIWLSNRFVITPRNLQKFNNAGVSLYPIDIDGACFSCRDPRPNALLDSIAAQTGGVAFHGRSDINVAMREAMDDGSASYILGFYAPGEDATPQTHRITVHIRRDGVEARYHQFYQTEAPRPTSLSKADMAKALNLSVDLSDLPIKVALTKAEGRLNVLATFDVVSLDLGHDHDLRTGKLELLARFTTADGIVEGDVISQTLTLNLRPESYEAASQRGLGYKTEFNLPAKAHELKLLLANPATGKIGTLTIPIDAVATAAPAK